MNSDIIKYALEYIIRRHDIDEDVKNSARLSLKDRDYLFQRVKKLKQVLSKHHQWHQDIGLVKLIHENSKETELDLSTEYSDSSLCDDTMDALSINKASDEL